MRGTSIHTHLPKLDRPRPPPHSTPIACAMFLQRSAIAAARRAAPAAIARRTFTTSFVRRRNPPAAIVRRTIDTIAGDAKPDATHEKEAGHSANAPSVLEGFKKLERT